MDLDSGTLVPSEIWGKSLNWLALPLANYDVGQVIGPIPNPSARGARVLVYVDSATTGYEAAATAVLGYGVDSITITNGGSSYETPPTVEFSGGGGTGAAGTAVLTADAVTSVTITDPGTGYTSAPTVAFTGGGGADAAGTAVLTATAHVYSVTVTEGGQGYASAPTVVFTGGGGTLAAATATLAGDAVASIAVDTPGSGYTSVPAVSFTGGGTAGTVKVGIETQEISQTTAVTLLESATFNSTGLKGPYTVYPGVTAAANVAASTHVGDNFYIRLTHSAAGRWSYTMTVQLLT